MSFKAKGVLLQNKALFLYPYTFDIPFATDLNLPNNKIMYGNCGNGHPLW